MAVAHPRCKETGMARKGSAHKHMGNTMTEKNIHQRLAEVMQAVTYIQKERKQGMQYTIVSHDKVTAKVRPALLEAGIVYYPVRCEHTHNGNRAECGMTIRFVNIDTPSDFFDVQTFGYGVDGQDKGPGKAMSYAVKYALLKALGLETGDDADHDDIDHSAEDPHKPVFNPEATRDRVKAQITKAKTLEDLGNTWRGEADAIKAVQAASEPMFLELNNAKDEAKARLGAALTNQGAG